MDDAGTLKTGMSRQEKCMNMLLKHSQNTILLLDRDLNIACYTDNFFRETVRGKTPQDIEGKNVFTVFEKYFGGAAAEGTKRVIEQAISSKETRIIKETIRYSGGARHLVYYVYITPAFDNEGGLDGLILLYANITKLEDARLEAEAANKTKSEFLAKISHANGKLDLTPVHFNIHALFDNICSMQSFIAGQKSLEFKSVRSPSVPQFIYADETRLNQIFSHLINNAIKYTKEGFVSFVLDTGKSPRDKDKEYLIAEISDTGIGIKQENLLLLFESFQDTRKNEGSGGTGLGLAIVKQLLTLLGGFIDVESEYGQGSVFTVYIPLVRGDPSKADAAAKPGFEH
jgi:hypothetical protein